MDELEFRTRVYADPQQLDQEVLDAASANPELQNILDQTRALDTRLKAAAGTDTAPAHLRERLLAIPATDTAQNSDAESRIVSAKLPWFRNYALAASLVLALGASFTFFVERGPSAEELAFGNQVIEHIYHEVAEIDAINAGTLQREFAMPAVNEVMANSGTQLRTADFMQQMAVRYANPCYILAAFSSSHLILQSEGGAISIITIDNPPVSQEFVIGDDRFSGVVVPLAEGNLIIVGERQMNLDSYRDMFSANLEWVI